MVGLLTILVLMVGMIVLFPLLVAYNTYNRIMALDARCDTAFADIDVQLKRRHDLIPGIVESVRGYAKHEQGVLDSVAKARAAALSAATPEMKLQAEQQLGQSIVAMLHVAENYPDLKASSHFKELEQQLADTENRVAASRRFFNLAVEEYNVAIRQFPGSQIAQYRRLSTRRPYDIGIERVILDEPVRISF